MGKASNRKKARRAGELWEGPNLTVLAAMEEPLRWLVTQDGPGWNDDQDTPCRFDDPAGRFNLVLIEAGEGDRVFSVRTTDGHVIASRHDEDGGLQVYGESRTAAYAVGYITWVYSVLSPDLHLTINKPVSVASDASISGTARWAASAVAFQPPEGVEVTPLLEEAVMTMVRGGTKMSPSRLAVTAAAMIR